MVLSNNEQCSLLEKEMTQSLFDQMKQLFSAVLEREENTQSFSELASQIREAGAAVLAARQSVALAKAQHQQDIRQSKRIAENIADLETRACEALKKGETQLAREAAEAIAILQDEKAALDATVEAFQKELSQLTENLHKAEFRLRNLKRGERTAMVREMVMKATSHGATMETASLSSAEVSLNEIEARQERAALADQAFRALAPQDNPKSVVEKLANAGCGAPTHTTADAVLDRLKAEIEPKLMIENQA